MARNVSSTSAAVTPSVTCGGLQVGAPVQRGQRRGVDLAVLTYLERQGVEAEGLHLPAQALDLPVGDALHVVGHERRLELLDLLEQLRG